MNTKSVLQYIAGFIDGDGCISIDYYHKGKTFSPRLHAYNAYKAPLSLMLKTFGVGYLRRFTKPNPEHKPSYRYAIHKQTALLQVLRKLSPYLVLKRQHAHIVLKAIKENNMKKYYKILKQINKRGV